MSKKNRSDDEDDEDDEEDEDQLDPIPLLINNTLVDIQDGVLSARNQGIECDLPEEVQFYVNDGLNSISFAVPFRSPPFKVPR